MQRHKSYSQYKLCGWLSLLLPGDVHFNICSTFPSDSLQSYERDSSARQQEVGQLRKAGEAHRRRVKALEQELSTQRIIAQASLLLLLLSCAASAQYRCDQSLIIVSTAQHSTAQHSTAQHSISYMQNTGCCCCRWAGAVHFAHHSHCTPSCFYAEIFPFCEQQLCTAQSNIKSQYDVVKKSVDTPHQDACEQQHHFKSFSKSFSPSA